MNKQSNCFLSFVQQFLWTLIFLSIVVASQVFVYLEKIPGYPSDLWSSYFLKWWAYTAPFVVLGMLLVSTSKNFKSERYKSICNFLGRVMVFVAIFSNYLSLLATG